jgi:thiol-disulfide isomerase/thioredoxin
MRFNRGMGMLLALALGAGFSAHAAPPAAPELHAGDVAPDLLGKDRDDNAIRVSDHRGKVVALTFWATWCGYCLKELPILENLQRRLGKERIEVVAINIDKDRADYLAMRRRLKGFELTMTEDDRKQSVASAYGVSNLPHLVLIDKAGHLARVHVGYAESMLGGFVEEINTLLDE